MRRACRARPGRHRMPSNRRSRQIPTTGYRRQPIFDREVRDLFLMRIAKRAPRHDESDAARLSRLFERGVEFVCATYFHRMKLRA